MTKSKFLLVDLNDSKTKKLAKTITSDTSRNILDYLAEKDGTISNIAKEIGVAVSTAQYHLQNLEEAGLIIVEEFHYSPKGKEVNHYKLANQYIIIAPKKKSLEIKQKLKKFLPIALIVIGLSAMLGFFATVFTGRIGIFESGALSSELKSASSSAQKSVRQQILDDLRTSNSGALEEIATNTSPLVERTVSTSTSEPNLLFWFFLGVAVTSVIFLLIFLIRRHFKKKKR